MYNKKLLSKAVKDLGSRKAPPKKQDKVVNNKLLPFISSEGFKQGPPPAGTNYRIPGNTIYNPTPYNINAVGSNGEQKFIAAGDTRNHTFDGAEYVDEYQAEYGGDISIPQLNQYEDGGEYDLTDDQIAELKKGGYVVEELPKKKNSKRYSRSLLATNPLFVKNPFLKKAKSKKRKIFDPNAKYYQDGGEAVDQYQKGGPKEQYYTYAKSKNKYKKVGNQWYISNEGTGFDFVPIKDPTGSRAKELNKNAKIDPNPWVPSNWLESKVNTVLGDAMGAAGRAGEFYKQPGEDDVDNIRHAYSGYRTAKAIADATGNIPYVSNPLGYIGSSILGAAHEVKTMFSDPRSWGTVLSEGAEDEDNNITGARMLFNQQSPTKTVKNIASMSRQALLPDGYAGNVFGPNYVDPYELRQRRISESKPGYSGFRPVTMSEKLSKGGFQDDINKRRKLLRDWTYGQSIGMLQKAQEGLETRGTEEQPKELPEIKVANPNDEVIQLMKAKRDELSYAKNDRQKKQVTQRYDRLITKAKERKERERATAQEKEDSGSILTGPKTAKQVQQEVLTTGEGLTRTGAERIRRAERKRTEWETAEQKRITREEEERKRQELKESTQLDTGGGEGTSTYVDTPKFDDIFGRKPGETILDAQEREDRENQEAFVKYLVDASNKKITGEGVGRIEQVTTPAEYYIKSIGLGHLLDEHTAYAVLQDLMSQDPEGTAQGLEDAKYKVWQKSEQAAYNKMDPFWKVMNNLGALAADPVFYTEQTIKGERSLVGQGQRSVAPQYYEDSQYYDKALGDKGDINALINLFNPMAYGAAAGEDALRGKYGDAAVNALQGVLALASGAGIAKGATAGFKALNKSRAIFNPITGKATGYTVNLGKLLNTSILAEGVARDLNYVDPESSIYMVDKLLSGEKEWKDVAPNLANNLFSYVGMRSTVDDIVSGYKSGGKETLQKVAEPIIKNLDKPLFSLKSPTLAGIRSESPLSAKLRSIVPVPGKRLPAIWNPQTFKYEVMGPRQLGQTNISAADILRGSTLTTAIQSVPATVNSVTDAYDKVTSDIPFSEKYAAIKNAGYNTASTMIGLMAGPKITRGLYSSPQITNFFIADYYNRLLTKGPKEDPGSLRIVFPLARAIAPRKTGGETYEIDDKTRRVLAKLGYQVEDVD